MAFTAYAPSGSRLDLIVPCFLSRLSSIAPPISLMSIVVLARRTTHAKHLGPARLRNWVAISGTGAGGHRRGLRARTPFRHEATLFRPVGQDSGASSRLVCEGPLRLFVGLRCCLCLPVWCRLIGGEILIGSCFDF